MNSLNDICQQFTKKKFKDILLSNINLSKSDVKQVMTSLGADLHSSCCSDLSTEYRRRQYFQQNYSYVQPQVIHLGTDENHRDCYVQYIPVKETLKALLKDPTVWQECLKSHSNTTSTVLTDVCDGSVFKSNGFFVEPGLTLKLILYQDYFTLANFANRNYVTQRQWASRG